MSDSKGALNVGIDLGTSHSAVSASNGQRHVIESYVGWPVDMVARKVLKKEVLVGTEAVENRTMLDLQRPLERGLLKDGSEKDLAAVKVLVRSLLDLAGVDGDAKKRPAVRAVVGVPAEAMLVNKQQLRKALEGMPGVKALNFNLMGRTLTVSHDLADLAPVTTAIERLGMAPVLQSTSDPEPSAPRDFGTSISRGQWIRMAVSGVLALGAEAMVFAGASEASWPIILACLVAISLGGVETLKKGWIALKTRSLNMNLLMTVAVESGALRREGFTGPRSFRWEGHVLTRDVDPPFKGTYSAGPMQVLATTARDLVARFGRRYDLDYDPHKLAPAYRTQPDSPPAAHPLYDPRASIDLGAAVIRRQLGLTSDDPILVAAAYNSGGLYESRANAWRLRSHSSPPWSSADLCAGGRSKPPRKCAPRHCSSMRNSTSTSRSPWQRSTGR